mgnify:CR=1 FL=1
MPFAVQPHALGPRELARAADLLREAAALSSQPTLKAFLTGRAEAFLSNDYYASDVAWMELDASIEPTIGPYEVYEDEWFNYKAAFEAFIAVRDAEAAFVDTWTPLRLRVSVGQRFYFNDQQLTLGNETRTLRKGDSYCAPGGVTHSVKAGPRGARARP